MLRSDHRELRNSEANLWWWVVGGVEGKDHNSSFSCFSFSLRSLRAELVNKYIIFYNLDPLIIITNGQKDYSVFIIIVFFSNKKK